MPGGVTEGFYSMTPILYVTPDDPRPAVRPSPRSTEAQYRQGTELRRAARLHRRTGLTVQALKNAGKDLTVDSFVAGMESIKDWHDMFGVAANVFQRDEAPGIEQIVPLRSEGRPLAFRVGRAAELLNMQSGGCVGPAAPCCCHSVSISSGNGASGSATRIR